MPQSFAFQRVPQLAALATIAFCTASPALADIEVKFREGAPTDRFTFTNVGGCDVGPSKLVVDLSGSRAGLIFDTSGSGAGVEVFQPYQTVAGGDVIAEVSPVTDGDSQITLSLRGLAPGQSIAFTIDVDDTLTNSALGQIRVSDAEIAGAQVTLARSIGAVTAAFDQTSSSSLATESCSS